MKKILFLNSMLIMLNSCNYGYGVKKETQKKILTHKQFIKDIFFEGKVIDKIYCNECNFNKYQIKINTNETINEKVELSNLSFPPYYSISKNNEIILSVNSKLYEAIQNSSIVVKKTNSNNILIKNKEYNLISDKKYQWIPR